MDNEKYIIDNLTSLAGELSPYQIFCDWVNLQAISIQNACLWVKDYAYIKRECTFKTIAEKYTSNEFEVLSKMHFALSDILSEETRDVLGDIYMKAECGNKSTGQFFTPYYISYLTARTTYLDQIKKISDRGQIKIMEPSSGTGGMIIAVAQLMRECKIDYRKRIKAVAQDLDWNCVYMTYVQLSLLGIKAVVAQGDSIEEPYRRGYPQTRIFKTPAEIGVII